MREPGTDSRGQLTTPTSALVIALVGGVMLPVVFQTLLKQIPHNAPPKFCGGTCGTISNLLPVAMVLFIALFVLFLRSTGVMGRFSS